MQNLRIAFLMCSAGTASEVCELGARLQAKFSPRPGAVFNLRSEWFGAAYWADNDQPIRVGS